MSSYVILHGRGHQRFDLHRASDALGRPVRPLTTAELQGQLGLDYGRVSPFTFLNRVDIPQVCDRTLFEEYYHPFTLMTNCGDLRFAVEFRAKDLLLASGPLVVADIVEPMGGILPTIRALLIVSGDCPEAGLLLAQRVTSRIKADDRLGGSAASRLPRMITQASPEFGLSSTARGETSAKRVAPLVGALVNVGVVVVVCADVSPTVEDEVRRQCEARGVVCLSQRQEATRIMTRNSSRQFTLLELSDHHSSGIGMQNKLRRLALAIQGAEAATSVEALNHLRDVLGALPAESAALNAIPEVSIFLSATRWKKEWSSMVDTLDLLADTVAQMYISDRLRAGGV